MLHEFSTTWKFFNKGFQLWVPFKLLFRIPQYLQKICASEFFWKSASRNTNWKKRDLRFWVYSYRPQCCSLVLRILSLNLVRNDFAIIKTLMLSGKNAERGYHNLIHKQAVWVAFCRWNSTFLGAKWKKWSIVTGGNFKEVAKPRKRGEFAR